jgi:hypothetical protein
MLEVILFVFALRSTNCFGGWVLKAAQETALSEHSMETRSVSCQFIPFRHSFFVRTWITLSWRSREKVSFISSTVLAHTLSTSRKLWVGQSACHTLSTYSEKNSQVIRIFVAQIDSEALRELPLFIEKCVLPLQRLKVVL